MDRAFFYAVVEMKVKASRHRNKDLSKIPVTMTSAFGHGRNVEKEINTLHFEGYVYQIFYYTQVSASIMNDLKLVPATALQRIGCVWSWATPG